MKKIALLGLALALSLAGCKTDQNSHNTTNSTDASVENSQTASVKAPDGRWFSNPLHCEGKLPVSGTYDFSVSGNTLTYIGIGDNGAWVVDSQNDSARKAFEEKLGTETKCLGEISLSEFQLIKFVGKVTEYAFAYSEKSNLLLRYNGGLVEIIVPFDVEKIKALQLEDNTDVLMPLESATTEDAPH